MNHSPLQQAIPSSTGCSVSLRRGPSAGGMILPIALALSISALAQAPGLKFRGNLPTPPPTPPANPGAPAAVELPEPAPVLPGSKIVVPRKITPAATLPTKPATNPPAATTPPATTPEVPATPPTRPDNLEKPQLPSPEIAPNEKPVEVEPMDETDEPRRSPRRKRSRSHDDDGKSVQPPDMPGHDVPQIESANLFPSAKQQLETAAAETHKGWDLILHGGLRATYDSNIYIQERNEESDLIFTMSPGIAVGWGEFRGALLRSGEIRDRLDLTEAERAQNYFFLDYNPSYHLYTNNSSESSFEHDVRAGGRYTFTKLTLAANARFQTLNETDSDIGGRVEWRAFDARVGADYAINDKTTFEAAFDYNRRDFEDGRNDITEYRATGWIDRQFSPSANIALGYTHGWVDVDSGANQDFDQVQLRAVWKATDKLSARVTGGVEWRGADNREDSTEATFAVGLVYNPFDATSIFLNGFRRTATSASGFNEVLTATGFDARIVQRLGDSYYLTAAGGFQTADYDENLITGFSREDDYTWGRLSLGWDVNKWLTAVLAYEYRDNDSNQVNRSYQEHLFFLQFSFLF